MATVGFVVRSLIWLVGAALTLTVVLGAMIELGDSFVWVFALWLAWLALVAVAAVLDFVWSQGPSGPTPPETYR